MKVAIISGSKSDENIIYEAKKTLEEFGIEYKVYIASAHRSPEYVKEIVQKVNAEFDCIIAIAGLSAALPGFVASYSILPVIGVPVDSEMFGLDALLSITQMPKGVPVASMGIGKKGAHNAALFVARMFAQKDPDLKQKLLDYIKKEEENIRKINEDL
ncbi:5-(carboxyamino)imidazole ribonucleotide mutase [Desulfurella sp.]|uniref:5-(carboxyamino)imidazole ribonucleotide mutase n=1 Tax=Desulfurella sp. TaxID=1962857 RepID=UPI0025C2A879|nr:5-(carboxyamino)imidazole ribonucleotide mutase [Desulfurella sp.]